MTRVMIEELSQFSEADATAMEALMQCLSPASHCTTEQLQKALGEPATHIYVVREAGGIVAAATLIVCRTPELTFGAVEAVAVLPTLRGRGLGRRLLEHIIEQAPRYGCRKLHLTSRPARVAANALYRSLGFTLHDTNCYEKVLH